jgi:hypothetical protein
VFSLVSTFVQPMKDGVFVCSAERKELYGQVQTRILLHFSTLSVGKLILVLEKHPLHSTQMQAI